MNMNKILDDYWNFKIKMRLQNVVCPLRRSMFGHLTGYKHRTKYIALRLAVRTADMDRAAA